MIIAALFMAATLSSSDAIAILLNSKAASSKSKFAVAMEVVRRDAEAGKPLQQFVLGLTTEDKELSKRCIEASCPALNAVYVHAPVCRPAWLVEMECIALTPDGDKAFPAF